jgi:hypothetical protein
VPDTAPDFYKLLGAAIDDLLEHGFDSQQRLEDWLQQLAEAARRALVPEYVLQNSVKEMLNRVYTKTVGGNRLIERYPGVEQFTLERIKPHLRAELDRRIVASASLIKLNRNASIQRTLQRFAGWATSVPAGGTEVAKRREVKQQVRRGIAALPFEERRVVIDQGHKLVAAINEIVASDGGAIAARWHHVKEGPPAYDARPEHVARDGKVYLIRGSWAQQKGLVKPGSPGYTDDVTQPAEEPFCRCGWVFLFALRDLPTDMLTAKGKEALLEARRALA